MLLSLLVAMPSGCVQMHPTRAGFLGDYSELQATNKRGSVRVKPVDAAALENVDSFYIEPVVWLADDLGQPAVREKDAVLFQKTLYESLTKELGPIRPIVDEIGPRTAVVRSAITGVREAQPLVNILLVAQIVGPLFNGGAVAEIEVVGPNGEQIAAQSVAHRGHDWDMLGFFWETTHTVSALRQIGRQLSDDIKKAPPPIANESGTETAPAVQDESVEQEQTPRPHGSTTRGLRTPE